MQHVKLTFYQRWAIHLVKLYPASWRERYAEEMLLILEDSQPTLKTICNIIIHLIDAYLHQNLVGGRTPYMLQRMRSNELVIYGATLIFSAAWFVAQLRVSEAFGQPTALFGGITTPSLLVNTIHSVFYILLLLILLGGLPILLSACWNALRLRKFLTLFLCLLGLISPLVTAVLTFLSWGWSSVNTSTWIALSVCFIGLSVDLALIFFAIQRVVPSTRITHYAFYLAMLIPLIIFTGLVTLLFGILPSFAIAFMTGGATFYMLRQGLLILIMVVAFSCALVSLRKSFQAKRAMRVTM